LSALFGAKVRGKILKPDIELVPGDTDQYLRGVSHVQTATELIELGQKQCGIQPPLMSSPLFSNFY
jgi:hypothetical protein